MLALRRDLLGACCRNSLGGRVPLGLPSVVAVFIRVSLVMRGSGIPCMEDLVLLHRNHVLVLIKSLLDLCYLFVTELQIY